MFKGLGCAAALMVVMAFPGCFGGDDSNKGGSNNGDLKAATTAPGRELGDRDVSRENLPLGTPHAQLRAAFGQPVKSFSKRAKGRRYSCDVYRHFAPAVGRELHYALLCYDRREKLRIISVPYKLR
jgi:hypothetical protein